MCKFTLCVGAVVLCALTSPVWASPIVNGLVLPGEYSVSLVDTPGEVDYTPGLDIKTFEFDQNGSWYFMGLTVNGPALDTDGGSTSRLRRTTMQTVLYADAIGTVGAEAYFLDVVMNLGGVVSVSLRDGSDTPIPLAPADYQVSVGVYPYQALEVAISKSKMSLISTPYVSVDLNENSLAYDDHIEGMVPEPATLCLMGVGAAAALISRRKR